MAYDQLLAARVRAALHLRPDLQEKEMFGGVAFLVDGRMACGIIGRDLMVRVGPDVWPSALREPHARPMDFTGKPMNGYVYVAPAGVQTDAKLETWVERGVTFVDSLDTDAPRRPNDVAAPQHAGASRKGASKKKASRKKAPSKKAPSKKAPSKKASRKKAPRKKASRKKASRKKASRKKAGAGSKRKRGRRA